MAEIGKPKPKYWSRNLDNDTKMERQLTNFQVLMDWGSSGSDIDKILGSYQSPFTLGGHGGVIYSRLMNLERRLERYGIGHDGVREIINKRPQLLSTEARTVREALRNLTRYHGLKSHPEKVGKIITGHPHVLMYPTEWTNRFFSAFINYGFTEEQVVDKILLADSNRLRNSGKDIQDRLTNLEELGFNKMEVTAIACRFPQIVGYDAERTNEAFLSLLKERSAINGKVKMRFNEEQARALVREMPQILGLEENTRNDKFRLRMIIWHACRKQHARLEPLIAMEKDEEKQRKGRIRLSNEYPGVGEGIISDPRVLIMSRRTLLDRVKYARKGGAIDWRREKYLYQKRSQFEKRYRVKL